MPQLVWPQSVGRQHPIDPLLEMIEPLQPDLDFSVYRDDPDFVFLSFRNFCG